MKMGSSWFYPVQPDNDMVPVAQSKAVFSIHTSRPTWIFRTDRLDPFKITTNMFLTDENGQKIAMVTGDSTDASGKKIEITPVIPLKMSFVKSTVTILSTRMVEY